MGLHKLIKNLFFLAKNTLNNEKSKNLFDMESILEELYLAMCDNDSFSFPLIQDTFNTIQEIKHNKSICRFGDGEFELLLGRDIPFQKASTKLTERLKQVLSSNYSNILIALPQFIYGSKHNLNEVSRTFERRNGKRFS